jgi:TRAP-type uncharacterized transport system substrate-binding protein
MSFNVLQRGVFRGLVALLLVFAPLSLANFSAGAAPGKGKIANAKAGAKIAAKTIRTKATARGGAARSGMRVAAARGRGRATLRRRASGSGKYAKSPRWSRHHRAPLEAAAEPAPRDVSTQRDVPAAAKPAIIDTGRAIVPVLTGGIASTSARMASDLASVFDSASLRITPVIGKGTLADLRDLGNAGLADLALLQSDTLANLPRDEREALSASLAYIARLYNEEVHVVAGRDITDLHQLAGRKVNIDREGSASAITARLIFDRLGIAPHYVQVDQPTALAQLQSGDIAATVMVGGRPIKALNDFAGAGRFRLVPVPYDPALQDLYLPAKVNSTDYADLVGSGESIDTVAVGVLLAAADAPEGSARYRRVQRFTEAFLPGFEALRDPARHPKWREVNIAAKVSGWTRFKPAQDWLDRKPGGAEARSAGPSPAIADPGPGGDDEVAATGVESDDAQKKLYQEYREWKRAREKRAR